MTLRALRSADFSSAYAGFRRRGVLLGCSVVLLAAAGPLPGNSLLQVQIADSGPLGGTQAPAPIAEPRLKLTVTPAGLEPAPVPNPDADGPQTGGAIKGASLAPAFFSQKAEFAGDGFVGRSSSDDTAERRRQPAAGLGLSIPVQQ